MMMSPSSSSGVSSSITASTGLPALTITMIRRGRLQRVHEVLDRLAPDERALVAVLLDELGRLRRRPVVHRRRRAAPGDVAGQVGAHHRQPGHPDAAVPMTLCGRLAHRSPSAGRTAEVTVAHVTTSSAPAQPPAGLPAAHRKITTARRRHDRDGWACPPSHEPPAPEPFGARTPNVARDVEPPRAPCREQRLIPRATPQLARSSSTVERAPWRPSPRAHGGRLYGVTTWMAECDERGRPGAAHRAPA